MIWHVFNTVSVSDICPMLQRKSEARYKFNSSLKSECAMHPPSSNVAEILDYDGARVISCFIRISASIKLNRNIFTVLPGTLSKISS